LTPIAAKSNPRLFPITELDVQDVRDILEVNVVGLFNCLKEEMKYFKPEGGSIVNVGSVLGKYASAGVSAYSTSKHAMAYVECP
jgi:NAD(P)-dependent dehydrogenase (short-subunit alcohol dehydrogenase family)